MSQKMRRALEITIKVVETNTPKVQSKLSEVGAWANPVLVYSAAKYYQALDKLSKE